VSTAFDLDADHLAIHHDFAPRVSVRYGVGKRPYSTLGFGSSITVPTDNVVTRCSRTHEPETAQIVAPAVQLHAAKYRSARQRPDLQATRRYSRQQNRVHDTLHYADGVDQQLFRGATLSGELCNCFGCASVLNGDLNRQPVLSTAPGSNTAGAGGNTLWFWTRIIPRRVSPAATDINANIRPSRIWSLGVRGSIPQGRYRHDQYIPRSPL